MKPTKRATEPSAAPADIALPETEDVTETAPERTDSAPETEVSEDETQPTAAEGSPPETETEAEAEAETSEPAQPAVFDGATVVPASKVSLNGVECDAALVPLDMVLGWLGDAGRERVEILKGEHSTAILAKTILGNDGRCTPTVFSEQADGALPGLLLGYETLAAAAVASIAEIPVLFVPTAAVGDVSGFLASRETRAEPLTEEEEDFIRRAYAQDEAD